MSDTSVRRRSNMEDNGDIKKKGEVDLSQVSLGLDESKNGCPQGLQNQIFSTQESYGQKKVAEVKRGDSNLSCSSTGSEAKFNIDRKDEPSSALSVVLKLTVSTICGIILGFVMEKARVFEPKAIRDQMVFEEFIMLKTFLSAVATGQLCFVLLSVLPTIKGKFERAIEEYTACFLEKSFLTAAGGSFLLGIGLTLSGACPAMVLVQVGTWVPNGVITMIGCLVGALLYGLIAPFVERLTRPKNPIKKHSVTATFQKPFFALALPMAIMLGVVVFIIEWFWPWTKDAKELQRQNPSGVNIFTARSWPPYASGIILGLLQLPLVLFVQDTVGGSSAYITVVSQWVVTEKLQKVFPYLAKKRTGVGNWWQVFLVCGAVLGGLISALASDSVANSLGCQGHISFFGGFIMIFGARFASGCTSGHGISGMALLIWMSFVAVPFIFAGGIATAFAMKATGALDTYVTDFGQV